jgi:hypothetical protein
MNLSMAAHEAFTRVRGCKHHLADDQRRRLEAVASQKRRRRSVRPVDKEDGAVKSSCVSRYQSRSMLEEALRAREEALAAGDKNSGAMKTNSDGQYTTTRERMTPEESKEQFKRPEANDSED